MFKKIIKKLKLDSGKTKPLDDINALPLDDINAFEESEKKKIKTEEA
jgi:hypothetical protein